MRNVKIAEISNCVKQKQCRWNNTEKKQKNDFVITPSQALHQKRDLKASPAHLRTRNNLPRKSVSRIA